MNENAVTTVCRALVDPAMQEKFRAVLPPDVPLDRFTRVSLTAVQNNPSILECDRQSLYNAFVAAATRGLLPDGREGVVTSFNVKTADGWIKKAQFMPMVGGILKEMAKAGIKAHAVSVYERELDKIEIWNDDTGQHFKHVPQPFGDRGERVGAIAWAQDKDGRTYVETLNREEIARIMARSKSRDKDGNPTGPWRDMPERMEQKSALHRLRNRVAVLAEFSPDDVDYDPDDVESVDVSQAAVEPSPAPVVETPAQVTSPPPPSPPVKRRPRGLQAVVDAATAPPDEPAESVDIFD